VQVVRQTHEPMRFDGAQIENSAQNRSLQLSHHVWNASPRPQIAFEGVFKKFLNPVRVGVFFISLQKKQQSSAQRFSLQYSVCNKTSGSEVRLPDPASRSWTHPPQPTAAVPARASVRVPPARLAARPSDRSSAAAAACASAPIPRARCGQPQGQSIPDWLLPARRSAPCACAAAESWRLPPVPSRSAGPHAVFCTAAASSALCSCPITFIPL
jgi:hypothetical protein